MGESDGAFLGSGRPDTVRVEQVLALLDRCDDAGAAIAIAGGWGVDALVGAQTRPHGDLDVIVDADHLERLAGALRTDGFVTTVDWLPSRVELTSAGGGVVDVHPVVFAADGTGEQAGLDGASFHYPRDAFATGEVGGRAVTCLSVTQQKRFHTGYPLRDVDRHDLALLDGLHTAADGGGPVIAAAPTEPPHSPRRR